MAMTDELLSTIDLDNLDPFAPRYRADPHPLYHYLRERAPVHRTPAGAWVLTRYADCEAVLKDPARFSSDPGNLNRDDVKGRGGTHSMMLMDPPDHTRLRGLVNTAFTPSAVRRLRPRVRELVDELLDRAEPQGRMEVIGGLAHPLPVSVICDMLGVPPEDDRATFRRWVGAITRLLDRDADLGEADWKAGADANAGLAGYFVKLMELRRREPRDDLLSALMAAEEAGERLSAEELIATLLLLFVAGQDTTMSLIGNSVYTLLRNPDQLERLRAHPELLQGAIEEVLRWDSPVHLMGRFTLTEVEIGGHTIPAGQQVVIAAAAANRDPAMFPDPDRFDIGRKDSHRHLTFSWGIHFCLGAGLARLEAGVAVDTLVRRFPDLALADPSPRYRKHLIMHGLSSLEVTL